MFCQVSKEEQDSKAVGSREETMADNVVDTCVPITAAVQSIDEGHVPEKMSKYVSCMTSSACNTSFPTDRLAVAGAVCVICSACSHCSGRSSWSSNKESRLCVLLSARGNADANNGNARKDGRCMSKGVFVSRGAFLAWCRCCRPVLISTTRF